MLSTTVHVVMGIERGCKLNDANGASTRGALQQNVGIHESPAARSAAGIVFGEFLPATSILARRGASQN